MAMGTLKDDLGYALDAQLGQGHNVSVDELVATVDRRRCGSCKFWEQDKPGPMSVDWVPREDMGTCRKWTRGYGEPDYADIPADGCHVEDDEGWGCMVGAKFGCVLWEER